MEMVEAPGVFSIEKITEVNLQLRKYPREIERVRAFCNTKE